MGRVGRTAAVVLVLAGGTAVWMGTLALERRMAGLREKAAARGLTAREVGLSWPRSVRMEGLLYAGRDGVRLSADEVTVRTGLVGGGDPRAHVRQVTVGGLRITKGALTIDWPAATFDVLAWEAQRGEERLRLRQRPAGGIAEARWSPGTTGRRVAASLTRLDLSAARVSWNGEPVLMPGTWTGELDLRSSGRRIVGEGALGAEGVRLSLPKGAGLGSGAYGTPVTAALDFLGTAEDGEFAVSRLRARLGGLELTASGSVLGPPEARRLDVELSTRADLGSALQATALRLPANITVGPGDRLGTAALDLTVRGPLADPAQLDIVPRLRYDGTPAAAEKLEFLRRPFRYTPEEGGITLDVRHGAVDFAPLGEIPPLFLRALLISEDAGFYGHPGIDVAEIPVAWAANLEKGRTARGASTITQQLVKNLFLARDKSYARKLEEAALALLLDAAVPKPRILEIYVNVIEWGPGVYGLVPAARHYFGKRPDELTAKESAFLVCLIPSPVRYHQAHSAGRLGPGMEQLTANLLAKLRSVDALSEEEYLAALDEEIRFAPEPGSESLPGA